MFVEPFFKGIWISQLRLRERSLRITLRKEQDRAF